MGYPNVADYHWPIYFTSPSLSIQSVLYYLSAILQDRGLSYRIYQPAGVGNGPDTTGYPPGEVLYGRDIAKWPRGGRSGRLFPKCQFSIFYSFFSVLLGDWQPTTNPGGPRKPRNRRRSSGKLVGTHRAKYHMGGIPAGGVYRISFFVFRRG